MPNLAGLRKGRGQRKNGQKWPFPARWAPVPATIGRPGTRRVFTLMRHLGVIRGSGTLEFGGQDIGRANYEFDGYIVRPGEIVASGEIHMDADLLAEAFGRTALTLRTDDGHNLSIRFSGKRLATGSQVAHADAREGLPPEKKWRRKGA